MNKYINTAIVITAVGSVGLATFSIAEDKTYFSERAIVFNEQDTGNNIQPQTIDDGATDNDSFQPLDLPLGPLKASQGVELVTLKTNLAADYKSNLLQKYQEQSVSTQTLDLIREFEGFRAHAYIDTDGTPVIGYGLSRIAGKPVQLGDRISPDKADAALKEYLQETQSQIQSVVKVELTDAQLSALTSLSFNVGFGAIKTSTLMAKLNAEDYHGAANEFLRWDQANVRGRLVKLPGLTRRRQAERKLFLQ